jgi:hypothetical protein
MWVSELNTGGFHRIIKGIGNKNGHGYYLMKDSKFKHNRTFQVFLLTNYKVVITYGKKKPLRTCGIHR